jgi:integrase/recombinase XerC
MRPIGVAPGAASLHLADGVSLLRPEDQVFSAMLAGFANQQLARNLARSTVEGREHTVRARSPTTSARFPGSGRRRWLMSGLVTCGRCGS